MKNSFKYYFLLSISIILFSSCSKDSESEPVVIKVPEAAILVSPAKDQICELGTQTSLNKSKVIFKWLKSNNTNSYDLIVSDPSTGAKIIEYKDVVGLEKEVELDNNHAYVWKVISKNSSTSDTGTSATWNFFLVNEPQSNYAPFVANIIKPEYGSSVVSSGSKVTLMWDGADPDGDALTYTIYFDTVDGKQNPQDGMKAITTTSLDVNVVSGTVYYWRVKSSDGNNSSFTPVYHFKAE